MSIQSQPIINVFYVPTSGVTYTISGGSIYAGYIHDANINLPQISGASNGSISSVYEYANYVGIQYSIENYNPSSSITISASTGDFINGESTTYILGPGLSVTLYVESSNGWGVLYRDVQYPLDNAVLTSDGTPYGKVAQEKLQFDNEVLYISGATQYEINPTAPDEVARLKWDDGNGTFSFLMKGGNVNQQVGQENLALCWNAEATTLNEGEVVYVSGSQGNRPRIKRALASSDSYSVTVLGVVTETIASGAEGFVCTFGMVNNLNTIGLTGGTALWLSPTVAGAYTETKPQAPQHTVLVGYVVRVSATVGSIFVHTSNGWELEELHNVRITNVQEGDLLVYDAINQVWVNSKSISGNTIIDGTLKVTGDTTLESDLNVSGDTELAGVLRTQNNVEIGGALYVDTMPSGSTSNQVVVYNVITQQFETRTDAGSSGTSGSSGTAGTSGEDGVSGGQNFFFNQSVSQDVSPYKELGEFTDGLPESTVTVNLTANEQNVLVNGGFITDNGVPEITVIPNGLWHAYCYFTKNAENDNLQVYYVVSKYTTGGTKTTLFTSSAVQIGWDSNNTTPVEIKINGLPTSSLLNVSDRIIVDIYVNNNDNQNRTVTFYSEGTLHYSYLVTTLATPSGSSGTSGTAGTSGTSGTDGTSGSSGTSATSGTSGTRGTSGNVNGNQ